jgi:hypothetical protein
VVVTVEAVAFTAEAEDFTAEAAGFMGLPPMVAGRTWVMVGVVMRWALTAYLMDMDLLATPCAAAVITSLVGV